MPGAAGSSRVMVGPSMPVEPSVLVRNRSISLSIGQRAEGRRQKTDLRPTPGGFQLFPFPVFPILPKPVSDRSKPWTQICNLVPRYTIGGGFVEGSR